MKLKEAIEILEFAKSIVPYAGISEEMTTIGVRPYMNFWLLHIAWYNENINEENHSLVRYYNPMNLENENYYILSPKNIRLQNKEYLGKAFCPSIIVEGNTLSDYKYMIDKEDAIQHVKFIALRIKECLLNIKRFNIEKDFK